MENNELITHMEFMTLTDDEIISQGNAKLKHILSDFKKKIAEDSSLTLQTLAKEEFKYIRLNIENMFIVEGKVKIEYGITQDEDLGVISLPDILNMTLFKSIYSNSDMLLISDVIQEIFTRYKTNRSYIYSDTKENYLKEFLSAYSKKIQNVFELLMYCTDDTIEFRKIGNVVQIKTYNTVDNSLKYKARELNSYETFKNESELKPRKYMSLQEIVDTKPLDIDYRFIVDSENEKLISQLRESFDENYKDDPDMIQRRDEILNELYDKMKLIYR